MRSGWHLPFVLAGQQEGMPTRALMKDFKAEVLNVSSVCWPHRFLNLPPCLFYNFQKSKNVALLLELFLTCECIHMYTHTHTHTQPGHIISADDIHRLMNEACAGDIAGPTSTTLPHQSIHPVNIYWVPINVLGIVMWIWWWLKGQSLYPPEFTYQWGRQIVHRGTDQSSKRRGKGGEASLSGEPQKLCDMVRMEHRPQWNESEPCECLRETILGRRNSKYNGPEGGICLTYLSKSQAKEAGRDWWRRLAGNASGTHQSQTPWALIMLLEGYESGSDSHVHCGPHR